jgi:hypothetical protein
LESAPTAAGIILCPFLPVLVSTLVFSKRQLYE